MGTTVAPMANVLQIHVSVMLDGVVHYVTVKYVCIIVLDQNMVRAVLDQLIRANQMARRKGNASVALGTKAQIVASLILAVIVPERFAADMAIVVQLPTAMAEDIVSVTQDTAASSVLRKRIIHAL